MADQLRPPRPGDPIEARPLRRFLERANALAKLRVTGSVGPERMDAKLSGTGAPYTCTEQAGTASGGWSDRAGGRLVPCYELNAQAGLAGKVVPAWRDTAGVWRFEYARTGVAYIGPPSTPCSPCDIPQVDMTLTLQYANSSGGTSSTTKTLTYSAGAWSSPVFVLSDSLFWKSNQQFQMLCRLGSVVLDHISFTSSWSADTYALTSSTYSCSPFSADWTTGLAHGDQRIILTT